MPVYESGQTSRKSQAEARELSRKLSLKAQKRAIEIAKEWETEKPGFQNYTLDICPNYGYIQSWMQEALGEKQESRFTKWPIGIMAFALFVWYFTDLEYTLNKLVGDLAFLSAIGIWLISAVIFYLIEKGMLSLSWQQILTGNRQRPILPGCDTIIA